MSSPMPDDPYAPRPTFLQRHGDRVAAAAVFLTTVVLTVISFPPYDASEAAYTMLIPGIFWAYRRPAFKLYAATLLAAQAVAWIFLLGWLHHVTWAGLFLLGPFVGIWVGTWYLAVWWTMPRMLGQPTMNRLIAMIGLCALWAIIEWTRTWFLTGFPWLPLAASQWERPTILQIAAYTGSVGVSFVLVAANIGFAAYAHRLLREGATGFNKRSQEFFLALFLLMACMCVHFQDAFARARFQEPLGRVAFVQPYIPQDVKWDPAKAKDIVATLRDTTREAAATKPDLILWPEASTPWAVRGDPSVQRFVETLSREAETTLMLGSIAIEKPGTPEAYWFNSAFVVTPDGGLQEQYYSKRQLVAFGEYVPLRPVLGWLRKFVPIGDDFTRGEEASPLTVRLRGRSVGIGPLICYEDIYGSLARESVLSGANVLAVLTNNGWFGEGGAAYQHASHAVLRAVEMRKPVLRCGNGGWSGWIDEFGLVRAVLTRDPQGVVHTDPRRAGEGTIYFRGSAALTVMHDTRWAEALSFYARHGDWFVMLCLGLATFAFFLLRFARPAPMVTADDDTATG